MADIPPISSQGITLHVARLQKFFMRNLPPRLNEADRRTIQCGRSGVAHLIEFELLGIEEKDRADG
jgi:hypothetical protein